MTAACASGTEIGLACDCLAIDRIRRELATEHVGQQIYLFWEVTSTNDVLRRLAEDGAREGTVVLAEAQSAGRGRPGRRWFSPPAANLYASVLLRPAIPPQAAPVFSLIASLALSDAVWAEGLPAETKWHNDVVIGGRKVGGTLVAWSAAEEHLDYVILGVGVNLNLDRPSLAAALGKEAAGATSLREAAGRVIDRNRFAAAFLNCLEKWLDAYRDRGADAVLAAWRGRDMLAGRRVKVRSRDEVYVARVLGVNHSGRLVVETDDGQPREVLSGEIRIAEGRP